MVLDLAKLWESIPSPYPQRELWPSFPPPTPSAERVNLKGHLPIPLALRIPVKGSPSLPGALFWTSGPARCRATPKESCRSPRKNCRGFFRHVSPQQARQLWGAGVVGRRLLRLPPRSPYARFARVGGSGPQAQPFLGPIGPPPSFPAAASRATWQVCTAPDPCHPHPPPR